MRVRRLALAAALAVVVCALPARGASGGGRIRAQAQQTVLAKLLECIDLEKYAIAIAGVVPYDPEAFGAKVTEAAACLEAAAGLMDALAAQNSGTPYGGAVAKDAATLRRAAKIEARLKTTRPGLESAVDGLEAVIRLKSAASFTTEGVVDPSRADVLAFAESPDLDTLADAFDRKKDNAQSRKDGRESEYRRERDREDDEDGENAKPAKAPRDLYIAWTAAKRTQANAGFGFQQLLREMSGPFALEITAGLFDTSPQVAAGAGDAYGCLEVDAKGTNPVEFFSVCARPLAGGGVQAFASRTGGVNLQQTVFPGVTRVRLRIVYDGSTFEGFAKPDGADDAQYRSLGTFARSQGGDVWYPGYGAAGLKGRAEIGLDDLLLEAL